MMNALPTPDAVLAFWFDELTSRQWWEKSVDLDRLIASRFGPLLVAAGRCELYAWRDAAAGRLAEIIVLDQFSRNIHRDRPAAYACDTLALALAQTAVAVHADRALDPARRTFLYMPYMHSESPLIHRAAVALFAAPGMEKNLAFELRHQAIIDHFGRYPHRNAILGRQSTPAEIAFLQTPGSAF
jgi:uncharacterized protein (DUF924 family)